MSELKNILEKRDYKKVVMSATNIKPNPKRTEIEEALTEEGIPLPVHDMTFFLIDNGKQNLQVTYSEQLGEYYYTKLTEAT